MFTGLVTHTGKILSAKKKGDLRLAVGCPWKTLSIGESVAVNGVCLTVIEKGKERFVVDISAETVKRTAPRWKAGETVNLERALKAGDDVGGHFVTGHIDGIAEIKDIRRKGASRRICIKAPKELAKFIAPRGSVTVDGVSLTVNKVEGRKFWVNVIPHTWKNTALGACKPGDTLNLEIDIIARYVERMFGKKK